MTKNENEERKGIHYKQDGNFHFLDADVIEAVRFVTAFNLLKVHTGLQDAYEIKDPAKNITKDTYGIPPGMKEVMETTSRKHSKRIPYDPSKVTLSVNGNTLQRVGVDFHKMTEKWATSFPEVGGYKMGVDFAKGHGPYQPDELEETTVHLPGKPVLGANPNFPSQENAVDKANRLGQWCQNTYPNEAEAGVNLVGERMDMVIIDDPPKPQFVHDEISMDVVVADESAILGKGSNVMKHIEWYEKHLAKEIVVSPSLLHGSAHFKPDLAAKILSRSSEDDVKNRHLRGLSVTAPLRYTATLPGSVTDITITCPQADKDERDAKAHRLRSCLSPGLLREIDSERSFEISSVTSDSARDVWAVRTPGGNTFEVAAAFMLEAAEVFGADKGVLHCAQSAFNLLRRPR